MNVYLFYIIEYFILFTFVIFYWEIYQHIMCYQGITLKQVMYLFYV